MRNSLRLLALVVALLSGLAIAQAAGLSGPVPGIDAGSIPADFDCTTTDVPAAECEALVAFHDATAASAWWANAQWFKTPDVCKKWSGVTCDDDNAAVPHVVGLLISNVDLVGEIPEELAQLTQLESLILFDNLLGGEIPASLSELDKLTYINLRNNLLSGPIPPELADTPNLISLLLSNNSLDGPIPEALLGNCVNCPTASQKYGHYDLANNQLSGQLPRDIGRQTISTLRFSGNPLLEGPVPDTYPQLGEITLFYFHGTNVCIPSDPDVLDWLEAITTITSTQPSCDDFAYTLSGYVLGSVSQPLDNVWVAAGGGQGAFTDSQGYFEFTVPGGSHTVSPTLEDFTFIPPAIEVTVPPSVLDLQFRGYAAYTISGRITDANGQPLKDIGLLTDTLDGGITDQNGDYVIDMLDDGTYEVEPINVMYAFAPASRTVTVPPPATGVDFVATPVAFDPMVWADGGGWSTDVSPEIDDILKDLTPDTVLRFTCPDASRSATAGCAISNAYVVLAAESGARCNLFRLRPMPPTASGAGSGAYEGWLKMALPLEVGRCSDQPRVGAAGDDGSVLSFFAGQEAFLYTTADSYLSLSVAGPTAYVKSQGRNAFSIDSQPDKGRTTIGVYSGRVTVTPANPSLAPFELEQGTRVTVRGFDISDPESLPQLFIPLVHSGQ